MNVCIKAMGLSSSLGPLVPACAAFRAGLSQPSAAPDFETFFPGDAEPGSLAIHALGVATYGFSGVGRLVAILVEALGDLATRVDLSAFGPEAGLYVGLPDPEERGFTTGKDPSHEDPDDPSQRVVLLADRILPPALEAVGGQWGGGPLWLYPARNVAFAHALAAADKDLRTGRIRCALVCAVDSLCSPSSLELLNREERLKTSNNPTGLMPGEAGVALLLEPVSRGGSEGPEPSILLRAVSLGAEPAPPEKKDEDVEEPERFSDGRALAACVGAALGPLAPDTPLPTLVSDHDGQQARAHEWGMLRMQLAAGDRRLAECPAWMPAMGFGHTGVASGGVGVATAFRALQRGYSPSPSILVLSSSNGGERSAIHLVAG